MWNKRGKLRTMAQASKCWTPLNFILLSSTHDGILTMTCRQVACEGDVTSSNMFLSADVLSRHSSSSSSCEQLDQLPDVAAAVAASSRQHVKHHVTSQHSRRPKRPHTAMTSLGASQSASTSVSTYAMANAAMVADSAEDDDARTAPPGEATGLYDGGGGLLANSAQRGGGGGGELEGKIFSCSRLDSNQLDVSSDEHGQSTQREVVFCALY